ncbi:patatin-like phospholipase family protein [Gilvibacter sp.]|uniref:patatin-like phospholipase family protein n=1 Tax=Gilvibacter sp. TaxID=2729997 RepID=UPI003F4A3ABD
MRLRATFLFILLMLSGSLKAQEQSQDLKVGLVLSGGGAKGLAHIGALKVIEESGIRIDYIGGTSMGAIIGGLYASGYSATQLDSIFRAQDFDKLIQDELPRDARTFYEKADAEKYAITLPFDGFKVGVPASFSKGQNVYNLLWQLTQHLGGEVDFTQMPIPFFCMATDVELGTQVMLESGYLPRALTASGALPSLFSPVELDGRVLIDGGVINNYPVDELRAKGMDIIIGIDVQDELRDREQLASALDVLVQINNFRTIQAMDTKIPKTDIYINPAIDDFTVVSFDQGNAIVQSGIDAALEQLDAMKELAAKQQNPPLEYKVNQPSETLKINRVDISGNEKYTRSYVLGKLRLKSPSETSFASFSDGVKNLMATGNFQAIDYDFNKTPDDSTQVSITLKESKSRMLLRLGAHYDNLYKSAALVNMTFKRVLTNNDIVSLDLIAGDNIRYNFDYYVDKGYYWSIGLRSYLNEFETNVPQELFLNDVIDPGPLNKLALEYFEWTNQVYVQTLIGNAFAFGVGVEHKRFNQFSDTFGLTPGESRTYFDETDYGSLLGFLKYDTRDDVYFPTKGFFFEGQINVYLTASGRNDRFKEFSIAKARLGGAKRFGDFTVFVGTEGGFKIGDDSTRTFDFFLGGYGFRQTGNLMPFIGLEPLSFRGDTYLKADLRLDYEIFAKNHLFGVVNIANIGNNLFTNNQWIDGIDYSGYGLGYGFETFAGPLQLIYSYSPEVAESNWYVSLGFWF